MERTNKVIEAILTNPMVVHCCDWAEWLLEALWDYKTTWWNAIGFSPYEIVYGKNVVFPNEFEIKTLRISLEVRLYLTSAHKHHLDQLLELDKMHLDDLHHTSIVQQRHTQWYDRFIQRKVFNKKWLSTIIWFHI